jgi:hypothetical protein
LRWPRNTLYPQKLVLLRQEVAVAWSAYHKKYILKIGKFKK